MCSVKRSHFQIPEASGVSKHVECSALSEVLFRVAVVLPHLRKGTLGKDTAEEY